MAMKPRNHPTGIAGAVATILVILADQLGLDLTSEAAASLVGAVAVLVSLFTPRNVQ